MCDQLTSRRGFLKTSTASLAAVGLPHLLPAAAKEMGRQRIRLGAPMFNAPADPEELAIAHRKLGYRAAYCPHIALDDSQQIEETEEAFAKHDVVIAEVGRWVNLMDADATKQAAHLQTVTEGLALADAVNARCCVDIAGSMNPSIWYGPDPRNVSSEFFDAAVENARKIIDTVKPGRARFAYEMMGWALPDSADSYLKMLKAVDREAFAVHLDPCNLINSPRRFYDNTALLNECFDKLGPSIVSCHAKDLHWNVEMNVHFQEVTLGAGQLDFGTYLKRLAALPGEVPLMIEHMKGEKEYDQSRKYLFEVGERVGIDFESYPSTP